MTTKPLTPSPTDANHQGLVSTVPSELARRQHEFEQLLALQSQRRQREDSARLDEQKIEVREESLVQEAYRLSMAKASFHAEKISWKRAMEDAVRQEEDTRRAMEDARRAIEDERRKREDAVQTELDTDVKLCYERNSAAERKQLERKRRWIEEDRVRALEEALINQDVLDLHVHAGLRQHVKKHFAEIIGFHDANKEQLEIQIDALLAKLFDTTDSPNLSSSGSSSNLSTSGTGAVVEGRSHTEAPPSYKDVAHSTTASSAPIEPHIPKAPLSVGERSVASVPTAEPAAREQARPGTAPTSNPRYEPQSQARSKPTRQPQQRGAVHDVEVDDFAVLGEEESKPKRQVAPAVNTPPREAAMPSKKRDSYELGSPSSAASPSPAAVPSGPQKPTMASTLAVSMDDDPDFAFDMSIQSERPAQDDWEVVVGREADKPKDEVILEGSSKNLGEFFRKLRGESMEALKPLRERQLTRMLSDASLRTLLNPSFTDLNPFSKLVISTRDTWASCEQCGTYFDRMSIKQTCGTCNRSFCSKCGLVSRKLDLSLITSRVPESSQEIRLIFPKNKEDYNIEIKCCTSCDKTIAFLEAIDARNRDQRSSFFERQYSKSVTAKIGLAHALSALDVAAKAAKKPTTPQLHELEGNILTAMRKVQLSLDSIDQTVNTLRAELPVNPKTNEKFSSSTEIRTLLSIKTALMTYLADCKQSHTQIKIKLVGPMPASGKLTLDSLQPGHPSHR